jgi:hypothetical protein
MMSETFSDLCIDFNTAIEVANQSNDLTDRKALIAQASLVLSEARRVWQDELTMLRGMLQSLKTADSERIRLSAIEKRYRPIPDETRRRSVKIAIAK